jgi:hypothetical protein
MRNPGRTPTDHRGNAKNLNPLKISTFWTFLGLFIYWNVIFSGKICI